MNNNINKTNEKVVDLSRRVDSLYSEPEYDDTFYEVEESQNDETGHDVDQVDGQESVGTEESVFHKFSRTLRKADVVSDPVNNDLAEWVNEAFREGMADEHHQELLKTILRPANCDSLKEIKVHSAVWGILKPSTQSEDAKLRGIQTSVMKAASNLVKLIDVHAKNFDEESLALGMNALGLLGQSSKWISLRRKECHKRDMDPKLHHLCTAATTNTDMLYGDTNTIVRDIKDIQEMNKISRNIAGRSYGGVRRPMRGGARFFRGVRRVPYQYSRPYPRNISRGGRMAVTGLRMPKNSQKAEANKK